MQRFGQHIVEVGLVSASDVEESKQRQVVFGGSLDTALLEAGLLDESQLLQALSDTYGLPSADKNAIDNIDNSIPRMFPLVFAETYHLVPLRQAGDTLLVLINGEPDHDLLTRVGDRVQLRVEPVIALETRLHYAMNVLYGTQLLSRFQTLLSRLDGVTIVRQLGPTDENTETLGWGAGPGRVPVWRAQKPLRKVQLRELVARLEFATDRDTIVETLFEVIGSLFDFSALFMVQGSRLTGWRAPTQEAARRTVAVELDLRARSAFQTVIHTGAHCLGPLQKNPLHDEFLSTIDRAYPRAALIAPIRVAHRHAIILYADNAERGVSPRKVQATLILAQRAALAFTRIIRKRKTNAAKVQDLPEEEQSMRFDVVAAALPQDPAEVGLNFIEEEHVIPVTSTGEGLDSAAEDGELSRGTSIEPSGLEISFGEIDPSPEAATAAFVAGIADHLAAPEEVVNIEPDYVAFSEVNDEEALGDWEDVLVSAEEGGLAPGGEAGIDAVVLADAASHQVTWREVIEETKKAAAFTAKSDETVVVAGREMQQSEMLLDGLLAKDEQSRTDAVHRALNEGAGLDEALRSRFPGPIDFDPFSAGARVPAFPECSGITQLLAARGEAALSVVLPQLEHEDPLRRFFAVYFLLAVRCTAVVGALATRLYDAEPRVRYLAADALRSYARDPRYAEVVAAIREQLNVPVLETQVSSIQLLGQLRDAGSVPLMIPLIRSPYSELAQAAASSLAVICARDFRSNASAWVTWWQENFWRARPAWLIEGLSGENTTMRKVANYELQLMTGMTTHFQADAPVAERQRSITMWGNWWKKVSGDSEKPPAVVGPLSDAEATAGEAAAGVGDRSGPHADGSTAEDEVASATRVPG